MHLPRERQPPARRLSHGLAWEGLAGDGAQWVLRVRSGAASETQGGSLCGEVTAAGDPAGLGLLGGVGRRRAAVNVTAVTITTAHGCRFMSVRSVPGE